MRVVPTQLISIIDQYLPWVKNWKATTEQEQQRSKAAHSNVVFWLSGFVDLLEQIPDQLLILGSNEAAEFIIARAALRKEADVAVRGQGPFFWPAVGDRDCVEIVRTALEKCPDEAPSTSGGGLDFIDDDDWRNSLLTDLGEVERALANSEWKSATVIGGSILESLFLWAVNQRAADLTVAIASAGVKVSGPPDKWNLYELSEISFKLQEITEDTINTVRPGKNFRNLIHPGRAQRLGARCDRGTAYTAYGAIFNVIRDLRGRRT